MVDASVCVVVVSEESVITAVITGWLSFFVSDSTVVVDVFVVVMVVAMAFHLMNSPLVVLIEPAENNA